MTYLEKTFNLEFIIGTLAFRYADEDNAFGMDTTERMVEVGAMLNTKEGVKALIDRVNWYADEDPGAQEHFVLSFLHYRLWEMDALRKGYQTIV